MGFNSGLKGLSLLGDGLEEQGSIADRSQDVSFATAPGPVRRPTSPLVQWVMLSFEPRIKQLELKLIIHLDVMSTYEFQVSPSLPPRIFFRWCLGKQEGKFRSSFKAQITTCLEYQDVSNEQYW